MNYWQELFSDPSFMGALFGAIITGIIAIIVMKVTNSNNTKQEKKRVLNEFLKESRFLLVTMEGLIRHLNNFVKYQQDEESINNRLDPQGFPTKLMVEISHAKRLNETDIAEKLLKIKTINRNAFTRDTLNIYLEILSITEGQIEYFWKRSLDMDVSGVADILEDAILDLSNLKDTLEQKYTELEKDYNSI